MRRLLLPLPLVALALSGGCGSAPETTDAGEKGLGGATADAASDTRVLSEAQDAANRLIRVATDCEAVGAGLPEAREALEEAKGQLRTPTGQTTLDALERQLDRLADACGVVE